MIISALALLLSTTPAQAASCAPGVAHLCVRPVEVGARRRKRKEVMPPDGSKTKRRSANRGEARERRRRALVTLTEPVTPTPGPRWIVNGDYRGAEPALFGMARLRFDELCLNAVPLDWNPVEDMRLPRLTSGMIRP